MLLNRNYKLLLEIIFKKCEKTVLKFQKNRIAQVNALSGDIYKANVEQIKANFLTQPTQKTTAALDTLKSQQTANIYPKYNEHLRPDHHYDSFNNLSKKAREKLHKRNLSDAKSAFGGDEYLDFLRKNHPDLYEQATAKVETPSNNQNKKQLKENPDTYQSTKKLKEKKKQAEITSKQEHKSQSLKNNPKDKTVRKEKANGKYCTSQGIMTQKGRRHFDNISRQLDGKINVAINEAPNSELQAMGDYYRKPEAQPPLKTTKPKLKGKQGLIAAGILAATSAAVWIAASLKNPQKAAEQIETSSLSIAA